MGKTRDLSKKIGDIMEIFHAKMGTIKDKNSLDLTDAEEINKRWQEDTEELYRKGPNVLGNYNGVVSQLETDILEYEVKWALGSITTSLVSGGDGIPAELFEILKDNAVKVLQSICQQITRKYARKCNMQYARKTQQWPQDWKRTVFIPVPKKDNSKECSNYHAILLNPHVIKVMLKMLQTRLQQ